MGVSTNRALPRARNATQNARRKDSQEGDTISAMGTSAAFWAQHFRTVYVRAIESYQAGALERILPAFREIGEEADVVADAEYQRLGAMPAGRDDQVDMADLAERADRHGQRFYEMMRRVRQGWLNLVAVGLHHLVEQQQAFFFQNALATEENEEFKPGALKNRLAEHGISAENLRSSTRVWELRTAANAIKHGARPFRTAAGRTPTRTVPEPEPCGASRAPRDTADGCGRSTRAGSKAGRANGRR